MENNTDTEQVEKTTEEVVKTYTKEDLDNSFNAGVKKANSDWQKDEKYKEFLEWKKTSQSDADKLSLLQNENSTLTNENKTLKAQIEVNNTDVKKEFARFVTSEVMGMVNDSTDFATALENYKKENPQFFGETVIKKVQSSPALTGGTQPQTTNDIMNNLLRGKTN